jgi:hypothetical protein
MEETKPESKTKTDLTKYIVSVQGKDFITFAGLLAEAHSQGLIAIETNMLNTDIKSPIFKASVVIQAEGSQPKSFSGYGDACAENVAPMVKKALIRMAETRAVARALRFACNIDMAALEELDTDSATPADKPTKVVKLGSPTTVKVATTTKEDKTATSKPSPAATSKSISVSTGLSKPIIKKAEEPTNDFKRTEEPNFPS